MITTERDSKQIVEKFLEVFSTGDVDGILGFLAEDATWWVGGTMPGISGTHSKEEFRALTGGIAAGTKGGAITLTPLAWTVEGDRVAVETESYAELNNGRIYNNTYHFLFVLQGDKILRVKEFLDTQHTAAVFLAP